MSEEITNALRRTSQQSAMFAAADAFEAACIRHGIRHLINGFHAYIDADRRLSVHARCVAHPRLIAEAGHGFTLALPDKGRRAYYLPGEDRRDLIAAADKLAQWFADRIITKEG